ncbi:MAG: transposase [Verrucomicrobiales bacterium]
MTPARPLRGRLQGPATEAGGASSVEIAELVASALRFFDGQRYTLGSSVIMPNHVHVIVEPISPHIVSEILRSWKTFTSRQANLRLGRTGESFWQRESFDRWIRDRDERQRIEDYIDNNPLKAGLCATFEEWP